MSETIQERLRGPIKHPQECVNQRQEAADHIDAQDKRIVELEAYANEIDIASREKTAKLYVKIDALEADRAEFTDAWCKASQQRDDLEAALRRALNFIANTENELDETMECGDIAREALAKLDAQP